MNKFLFFHPKKIWLRIFIPTIITAALFIITTFTIFLPKVGNIILERKKEMLIELSRTAFNFIEQIETSINQGEITKEEGKKHIINYFQHLRFGDDQKSYFWITDTFPNMIMHPFRTDLNGKSLKNFKDTTGKKLFVEHVKALKDTDEAFVNYYWQWYNVPEKIEPKLSYVKKAENWNWIIGTGIYLHDIEKEVNELTRDIVIWFFVILGLLLILMFFIIRNAYLIENEKEKTTEKLIKNYNKLHFALDSSNSGIWEWDLETQHVEFSNEYYTILGYEPNEFPAAYESWVNLLHPEDKDSAIKAVSDFINNFSPFNKDHFEIQFRLKEKKGSFKWILARGKATEVNTDGSIKKFLGTHIDIQKVKQTEEAYKEIKDRYERISQNTNQFIFRLKLPEGRFEYVSPKVYDITGYKVEELLEKPFLVRKTVHSDFEDIFRQTYQQLIAAGKIDPVVEYKIVAKDKRIKWLQQRNNAIFDVNGEIIALEGLVSDITQRKLAEEKLKDSEITYREIYNFASDAIYIHDYDTGEILDINKAGENLHGFTLEELRNQDVDKISQGDPPYSVEDAQKLFERVKTEKRLHFIWRDRTKDGRLLWTENTMQIATINGVKRILVVGHDITEKKKAEDGLREYQTQLENLVKERTAELESTNEELKAINEELVFTNEQLSITNSLLSEEIDKRIETQKQLEESETKLRSFLQQSADGISIVDSEGNVVEWNNAIADIIKIDKETAKSKKIWDIDFDITPEYKKSKEYYNTIKSSFFKILQQPKTFQPITLEGEKQIEGKLREFVVTIFPIKIDNDIFIGQISRDITDKKIAEKELKDYKDHLEVLVKHKTQELEKSYENYRSLFEQASDGILVGNRQGVVIEVNKSFCQFSGYSKKEIVGNHIKFLFSEESLQKTPFRFDLVLEGKNVINERKIKSKTGELIDIEMSTRMLKDGRLLAFVRDITDRKQTEFALIESEERYRNIFDEANDAIIIIDENEKIINCNNQTLKLFRAKKNDIIHKTIAEVSPEYQHEDEPSKELAHELIHSAISGAHMKTFEWKHKRIDSTIVDTEVSLSHFQVHNKKYVQAIIRDVSERKEMENEIRQSELKYRLLFETSANHLVYLNPDENIVMINKAALAYWNTKAKNVINRNIKDLLPGKDGDYIVKLVQSVIKTRQNVNIKEVQLRKNDWFSINLVPIIDPNEKLIGIQINAIDITLRKQAEEAILKINEQLEKKVQDRTKELVEINTSLKEEIEERKRIEEALAENESKIRSIIENSPDGIFLIDDEGKIIEWNHGIERLTGIDKSIAMNDLAWNVFEKFNFKQQTDKLNLSENLGLFIEKSRNTKKSVSIQSEFSIINNNKEIVISNLNFSIPLKNTVYFASFNKDITKQKKAEKDIIKNLQKEKELNQLRSQFISTVSHEFRTPLANISSNTQLLDRFFEKWDSKKASSNFTRIYESVKDISAMLEDISLLGKEQSGRLKYHPTEINIVQLCNKVIQESAEVIRNNIKVKFINNLKITTIIADKNLLRQILTNILTNAMKYSSAGNQVLFEMEKDENKSLKFTITDKGIGIPKEDLENIYEPFQRASNVEKYKGSGLGLSIVKKFVDLHNGKIQINSQLKKGTKVTIEIPLVVSKH